MNRWILAIALTATLVEIHQSVAHADTLGGNDLIDRSFVDGADGILFTELNTPISITGTLDSWSIWADRIGGQVKLLIYRDIGNDWQFIGSSELKPVTALGLNTWPLANPIAVEAGDLIAWWYPEPTAPSIAYDSPTSSPGVMFNEDWSAEPIIDLTPYLGTIPDLKELGTTEFQGTLWINDNRAYSIAVHGSPPRTRPDSHRMGNFLPHPSLGWGCVFARA